MAKTLAPTIAAVSPRRAAATIRTGVATKAASKPTPWLTLLAISSPRGCPCITISLSRSSESRVTHRRQSYLPPKQSQLPYVIAVMLDEKSESAKHRLVRGWESIAA